jgi:hypothetical protein
MAIDEKRFLRMVAVVLLAGGFITAGVVGYVKYSDAQKKLAVLQMQLAQLPTSAGDEEVVARVASHFVLPEEQPKVVTITDADTLKIEQPFFAKAKNGDKLLVYSQKVILYSPVLDKIVEIAQIKPEVIKTSDMQEPSPPADGTNLP